MSKNVFLTIGIVLTIILIALVGYYFFMRTTSDIVTTSESGSIFKNLFPFGQSGSTEISSTTTETQIPETNQTNNSYTLKLRKISSNPVAGAGLLDTKAGTIVRHIEKATGHIYETELFSAVQNRISNTTLPFVYDAVWGNGNNTLISRYLKDDNKTISTYSMTINASSTSDNKVTAIQLPNIDDLSVFKNNLFYLQQGQNGSIGVISGLDGSKKKQVWSSQIKEVLSQFVNVNTVAITTKPYQRVNGYLYLVNTTNGQAKRILGDISGLSTSVSPDATKVLGISQTGDVQMFVYSISDNSYTKVTPATFPEKCVWGKTDKNIVYCAVPEENLDESSLTGWYMGLNSYTDDIWKYDTKNNTSKLVESLSSDSGEIIDVIKPLLSENEQYFVFINKKDGSLWSLDLTK